MRGADTIIKARFSQTPGSVFEKSKLAIEAIEVIIIMKNSTNRKAKYLAKDVGGT